MQSALTNLRMTPVTFLNEYENVFIQISVSEVSKYTRFFLTFMEPCIARYVFLYNQRDATYTVFFIIISALHVSGGFPPIIRSLYNCMCSGIQQESMTIPKAAHTVL
jgi:hypothetical protein